MNRLGKHSTINEWIQDKMHRARVFRELDIDFCCGGQKTLEDACREKGLDLDAVVARLTESEDEPAADAPADESPRSPQEWVDHIEATHHTFLREAIPSLAGLVGKVAQAHGRRHPELFRLQGLTRELFHDLESHLVKEEKILFPMIRQLKSKVPAGEFHCSNFHGPVLVMRTEHARANRIVDEIRRLTDNYRLPGDGCETYRLMLDRFKELELDLHVHMHKENDILFPGVLDLERSRQAV